MVRLKNHLPAKEVPSMLSTNFKHIGLDVRKDAITVAVRNGACNGGRQIAFTRSFAISAKAATTESR